MNNAFSKEQELYNEQGYLHFKKFVPTEMLDELKKSVEEPFVIQCHKLGIKYSNIEEGMKQLFNEKYEAFLGAARLAQHSIKLHEISCHNLFINKLKDLGLDLPYFCMKPIVFFNSQDLAKEKFHFKTPPHQDWRSMQGSLDAVVVWFPLVDIDLEIGALKIVPRSHKLGLLKSEDDPWYQQLADNKVKDEDFVSVEMDKGDALFFSSFLVHKSGENINRKVRWSVQFRFNNASEETFIDRKFPNPYVIYRPQKELIHPTFPELSQVIKIFGEQK